MAFVSRNIIKSFRLLSPSCHLDKMCVGTRAKREISVESTVIHNRTYYKNFTRGDMLNLVNFAREFAQCRIAKVSL